MVPDLIGDGPAGSPQHGNASRLEVVEEAGGELVVERPDETHHRVGADLVRRPVDEIGTAAGERGGLELAVQLVGLEVDGRDRHAGVVGHVPVELAAHQKLLLGILLLPDDDLHGTVGVVSPAAGGEKNREADTQGHDPCHEPPPCR